MKIKKHVLIWMMSGLLMCVSFSTSSLASTAGSQAGISFTEKDYSEEGGGTPTTDNTLPDTNGNGTSSYLPQTGEQKSNLLFIVGLGLLGCIFLIDKGLKKGEI
ncbi:LPXTG-motif cell wall anchor domain protein (fragment) [Carnobacterium maltaromaticum]|uniref:LPXTG cell wall anchor domain-containing protein n=1 Tax=Carnobacterium maltaromaticum TaxID=2751 RepID=A0AAW9K3G7_CARML